MQRMNHQRDWMPPQMPYGPRPRPRRRRRRSKRWQPHWHLIWAALAVLGCLWVMNTSQPSARWDDLADTIGIEDPERFGQLFVLGVVLVAITLIIRILTGKGRNA